MTESPPTGAMPPSAQGLPRTPVTTNVEVPVAETAVRQPAEGRRLSGLRAADEYIERMQASNPQLYAGYRASLDNTQEAQHRLRALQKKKRAAASEARVKAAELETLRRYVAAVKERDTKFPQWLTCGLCFDTRSE